jgi:RNA polymerase sigma-70 factor (ECF subfamily)
MAFREPFQRVLSAAQADAPWAYEQLYRALSPSVCGYLRVQGALDPEDLTSEVFLGVFRRIGSFSGDEDQFRSWVFTFAHRRLTDERRAVGCRPRLAEAPLPDPYGGDVEEEALRRLSVERVRTLCSGLAPDQCDVLLLRLISGLTVEAVAAIVGKSPGAVKALQRRGVAAIRRILEREGVPL